MSDKNRNPFARFAEPMLCLDPLPGTMIDDAIRDALRIASVHQGVVVVLFNGHPVRCKAGDTLESVRANLPEQLR